MSPQYEPSLTLASLRRLLIRYHGRWLWPAVAIAALSCVYAAIKRDKWEASQAVMVRSETTGGELTPGVVQLEDGVKATQEALIEIGRSRPVLAAALTDVGPPASRRASGTFPTDDDVDDLYDVLKLAAPKGAEFGKTEIFYIKLRDAERERAARLVDRICFRMEESFGHVRDARAGSMTAELNEVVSLLSKELQDANDRLATVERRFGSNLVELRMLEQSPAGVSELNREMTEAESEVREARSRQSLNRSILKLLREAKDDPQMLVTAPESVFVAQPNLKRLADGLVDVQLKTSMMLGSMTEQHPQVVSSRHAEEMVRKKIFAELSLALNAIETENDLTDSRVAYLDEQLASIRQRMGKVAEQRVEYASLTSEVAHRRTLLESAQRQLADARATQAVARKCSLINRIGTPETGSHPIGPGRSLIAVGGMVGGLFAGLGIFVMTVPLPLGRKVFHLSSDDQHELAGVSSLLNGNGHSVVDEPWKNRFASVP